MLVARDPRGAAVAVGYLTIKEQWRAPDRLLMASAWLR